MQLPDHTASIAVSPTAYLRLSEFERFDFDEWADGWSYEATIDARVATFSCDHYRLGFHDLTEFVRDLRKAFNALRGVVSLRKKSRMPSRVPETEGLTFRFIEATGHVLLSGDLGRGAALGASLKFQLAFDQTHLGPFLDDLEKINVAVHG